MHLVSPNRAQLKYGGAIENGYSSRGPRRGMHRIHHDSGPPPGIRTYLNLESNNTYCPRCQYVEYSMSEGVYLLPLCSRCDLSMLGHCLGLEGMRAARKSIRTGVGEDRANVEGRKVGREEDGIRRRKQPPYIPFLARGEPLSASLMRLECPRK